MERKQNIGRIIGWAVMIVLTLILLPILVMNIILIAKGSSGSLVPPDIGGVAPLNVTSGSMEGDREDSFAKGSLIFVKLLDKADGQVNYASLWITFNEFDNSLLQLEADGKIKLYIDLEG